MINNDLVCLKGLLRGREYSKFPKYFCLLLWFESSSSLISYIFYAKSFTAALSVIERRFRKTY